MCFFFFKQKTAYEMRISDWSSDVCSSDLEDGADCQQPAQQLRPACIARQRRDAFDQLAGDALQGGFEGAAGPGGVHGGAPVCSRWGTPSIFRTTPAPRHARPSAIAGDSRHPSAPVVQARSEEHTSELQSLMRNSYAVFCL